MSFVLDASVTLAWCFKEERGAYERGVLHALRRTEALVPGLWSLEVSNGLLIAERRGRLDAAEVERLIRMLLDLPVAVEPGSRAEAFQGIRRLARAHRLTAYDAAYLDLALRHGLGIATRMEPYSSG